MPSRRSGLHALFGAASLVLLLAGCGGGGSESEVPTIQTPPPVAPPVVIPPPVIPVSATVPRFAYAANQVDGTISIYAIDAQTGQLRANGYVVAGSAGGTVLLDDLRPVVIDPTNTFVYALVDGAVFGGRIDPQSGALTPASGSPFGTQATAIAIDPVGRFFYTANRLPDRVSAYSIDASTGALVPVSTAAVGAKPVSVSVDPAGKFVYVTNEDSDNISAFAIDAASGSLAPIPAAPFASGIHPRAMAINKTGTFAFVANSGDGGFNGSLSTYSIDAATGALALTASLPAVDRLPWQVALNPTGTFLYVANGLTSNVSAYAISASGQLTEVSGSPYATTHSALSIVVDPSGKFAYVSIGDPASNDIVGFSVDPATGALSPLPGAPSTAARASPRGLAIAAGATAVEFKAQFAYVANRLSNTLSGYAIETNGALTAVPGSPFATGAGPGSVAIDPKNRYVYVATVSGISAFAISTSSGSLAPVAGSPFTHPGGFFMGIPLPSPDIQAVAVDPSGRFLYAASGSGFQGTGLTLAFEINQASGALTPISGSPFENGLNVPAASQGPVSGGRVAVDLRGNVVYVSFGNSSDISALRINSVTGALTPVPGTPFLGGVTGPTSLSFHPTGKFLYVANVGAFANSIFEIDSKVTFAPGPPIIIFVDTGSLELLPFNTFVTNAITGSVAIDATGRFAYALDAGADIIRGFSVDRRTGVTTPFAGSPFDTGGAGGLAMTSDLSGKFVYVANRTSNNISAFAIDPTDGTLTTVPGSPFASGSQPISIAVTGGVQ